MGILQAGILEWDAIPFSKGSSPPRDRTWSPTLQTNSLTSEPPGKYYIQPLFTYFTGTLDIKINLQNYTEY